MGGRVKYKTTARGKRGSGKNLAARMAQAQPPGATSTGGLNISSDSHGIGLDKSSIAWLVVLSVIAIGAMVIVIWLLFGRKCRRHKSKKKNASGHSQHSSLEITDGRNEFEAWNPSAARRGTNRSEHFLAPLVSAAAKPAGVVHPGNPVVVEEIPLTPPDDRNRRPRYYSGVSSAWRRVSGIGKAF